MRNRAYEVVPVSHHIGAEIRGIDLAKPYDAETYVELRRTLAENGVIFFRDQDITPAQHDFFARQFGDPTDIRFVNTVEGFPNMSLVSKAEDQLDNIGGGWHADQTYHPMPPWGTVLVSRELPPVGGDTLFSSMAAAYDALSDGLKKTLDGLQAVHSNARFLKSTNSGLKNLNQDPIETLHPAVIRHPITGRKSLFVNAAYVTRFDGWTERESEALLAFLNIHGQRPEFQCRFHWEPGSIVFWDNIQVWHYAANDYHGHRRIMHRIAIKGEPLQAA